jgi:hypothetical protein
MAPALMEFVIVGVDPLWMSHTSTIDGCTLLLQSGIPPRHGTAATPSGYQETDES